MNRPGDRKPRQGECARCGRPLSDLEWNNSPGCWILPVTLTNDGPTCDAINASGQACRGTPIDWRSRALAAEAALADAEARGRAHGLLAAAMLLAAAEQKNRACVEPRASDENWWETRANAFKGAIGGIERLAAEATDAD